MSDQAKPEAQFSALEQLAARIREANCRPMEVSTLAAEAIESLIAKCRATPAVGGALVPKWAGRFDSHQDWVNRAQRVLSVPSHKPGAICVDAKGRRCFIGADMARARDEGTFPVRYFWECEVADPATCAQLAMPESLKRNAK